MISEGFAFKLDNGDIAHLSMPAQYIEELPGQPEQPQPIEPVPHEGQPAPKPHHEGPLPETGSSFDTLALLALGAIVVGGTTVRVKAAVTKRSA